MQFKRRHTQQTCSTDLIFKLQTIAFLAPSINLLFYHYYYDYWCCSFFYSRLVAFIRRRTGSMSINMAKYTFNGHWAVASLANHAPCCVCGNKFLLTHFLLNRLERQTLISTEPSQRFNQLSQKLEVVFTIQLDKWMALPSSYCNPICISV